MLGIYREDKDKYIVFYVNIDYSGGILMHIQKHDIGIDIKVEKITAVEELHEIGKPTHIIYITTNVRKYSFHYNEIQPRHEIEAERVNDLVRGVEYLLKNFER